MILQNFIVFEGIDGSGTSTQISLLKKNKDIGNILFTSEPTDAPTGKFLRQMLKGDVPVSNETAAYLFAADRNEHVNGSIVLGDDKKLITGIKEACKSGKTVISDRYIFSSLAYQSISCNPSVPRRLNQGFPLPGIVFYFEISPKEALKRITGREIKEIYEKEEFLNKTVDEYHKVLEEYRDSGINIIILDATSSIEEINAKICSAIGNL